MTDDTIQTGVVLVVRKKKAHMSTPQPRTVKLHKEDHDALSVNTHVDSVVHVDDKPIVVPIGDQTVEF